MLRRTLEMRHMGEFNTPFITTHHSFTTHHEHVQRNLKYVKGNTSYTPNECDASFIMN